MKCKPIQLLNGKWAIKIYWAMRPVNILVRDNDNKIIQFATEADARNYKV